MASPIGSLILPPGQYTHCVDRSAYKDVPGGWDAGFGAIAQFLICEYLLGGKLVCLAGGGDECALGVIIGIEEVGYQKSGFDAIDNDLSFNLLVLPYRPTDFAVYRVPPATAVVDAHVIRDDVVKHSPLGALLTDKDPKTLPTPREPANPPQGTSPVDGYGVLHTWDSATMQLVSDHDNQNNLHKISGLQSPNAIAIPIVHCECEGSRVYFVCRALKDLLDIVQGKPPGGPGPSPGSVCHALLDWVPFGIGKRLCTIIEDIVSGLITLALAPAIAAAFAAAWEAAQIYDDAFITGPVAKQIKVGDQVVVSGRFTWDAGHSGHTELHPVKAIQKVRIVPELSGGYDPRTPLPSNIADRVRELRDRWCHFVEEAPPPPDPFNFGRLSPPQLGALNPAQQAVYVNQQQPENGWTVHPLVDGCAPGENPPPSGPPPGGPH